MSRRGNCYDNAVMSFSTDKSELADRWDSFKRGQDGVVCLLLEVFYNHGVVTRRSARSVRLGELLKRRN